jgi:signal transduction histidine kinase
MTHSIASLDALTSILESPERVAAVRKTELLDTPPDPALDRLTELAARVIGCPAVFLSLVDAKRDFYKSHFGFSEPLRSVRQLTGTTFCHYTLQSSEPLVLDDVAAHPVYSQVPTVKSLGIGAYVGVPLINSEGHCIGAFCAIDLRPRAWTDAEIEILKSLAMAAFHEIKLGMALRELHKKEEESRYAAMARQEFLARVAHDLRNPLSAATIGIALLEYARLDEREMRSLQTTRQVLESMNAMIDDLLNISQFEAGKFVLRLGRVEASTVVHDALEVLSGVAESDGILLDAEAAPDLPAVEADYERVLRVFSNLVGNAIKFCKAGDRVVLGAVRQGDTVRFSVTDCGPGISQENIARLFDRYWQSDDKDQRGLGLGLSIVKAIVEAHRGEVGVDSVLGEGSTFWFTLPVAPEVPAKGPYATLWH